MIKQELKDVYIEAKEENWNDEGAQAVSYKTYLKAVAFVECLPRELLDVGVAADPDGEISFDWYGEGNRVFSASINSEGRLSYAAVYGKRSLHGTCSNIADLMEDIKMVLGKD